MIPDVSIRSTDSSHALQFVISMIWHFSQLCDFAGCKSSSRPSWPFAKQSISPQLGAAMGCCLRRPYDLLKILCLLLLLCVCQFAAETGCIAEELPATRRIYVPVEDLDALLDKNQRGVLFPREDFLKLCETAKKNTLESPEVRGGILLSRGSYQGRLSGDQLLIIAELELTQFANGWRMLPLPFKALGIEKVTVDGQPARVGRDP